MQVTIGAAQSQLSELIEAAKAGEEVVLADGETPVAKIVALQEPQKRPFKFGLLEGKLAPPPPDFFDPLDEEEQALWDGDA
jgi:antitoxin (DNA-binding transcriptional repressor) of toxin-antitoxin stability system